MIDELGMLNKISVGCEKYLKSMSAGQFYLALLSDASHMLSAIGGSIYLEYDGSLRRVFSTVPLERRLDVRKRGNVQKAFETKEMNIVSAQEMKKIHPEYKPSKTTHFLNIPMVFNNKSIGLISLQLAKKGEFGKLDEAAAKMFGQMTTLKLKNVLLAEELINSMHTRDMFISLAIHELNTPTTTLLGYMTFIKRKLNDTKYLESIESQLARLKEVVKKLERFNQLRGDSKIFVKRKFNIEQAVNRAIHDFRSKFPGYQLIIEKSLDGNVFLKGDIYKISQVLINILENSGKFSKDTTPIVIQLKKTDNKAIVVIKDKGVGIAAKDIKKVLAGHFKSGHTKEGVGLGLYISKVIIESYGGSLALKSQKEKGTQVTIKLPLA